MDIENRLAELVRKEARLAGGRGDIPLSDETLLESTGLDSLGFATIVVAMSEEYGVDPFAQSDEIVYPQSYGELVNLYRMACKDSGPGSPA